MASPKSSTKASKSLPEELLRRVRQIEITTRRVVDDLMAGQYKSHFKGHGVQFSEHRVYVPGDDVRHIDWKVSARSREPLTKKYEEERELTVFLVVDVSGSKRFGTSKRLKSEIAAEIGGLLAYAAVHSGDRVGALLFAGEIEKIIPPEKGRQHVLRIIKEIMTFEGKTPGTNLKGALEATGRIMKHSGVIFVISDFLAEDYDFQLKRLGQRHDVVAISIGDEKESLPPEAGTFLFQDPESGETRLVDASSYAFKKWFREFSTAREKREREMFRGSRVEQLRLLTRDDYGEAVVRFFRARSKRRR